MIALITDFGHTDHFVGVIKGIIKNISPDADIIDISHEVRSFSVINAQFILRSSYRFFPPGTIFCIIIDPGVGTSRKGIITIDDNYMYVLPDNGIISAVKSDSMKYYYIKTIGFHDISATFHGRDVFAPVAAYLSRGTLPEELGTLTASICTIPFPDYTIHQNEKRCIVMHIDKFGNATSSLPNNEIDFRVKTHYTIASNRYNFDCVCVKTYAEIDTHHFGLIKGSSGFIELAANKDAISKMFDIAIGDGITIKPSII